MSVNIVSFDNNSVIELTNSEKANLAIEVLTYMASSNTFTGSITVSNTNPIGIFSDTVRVGGANSSNVTILTTNYPLSQVNTATIITEDPPKYIGLNIDDPNQVILQENLTTLNDLADYILEVAVSGGPTSYYLGQNAPNDGDVWISLGEIKDTLQNFTVTVNSYKLWKKITSSGNIGYKKPLKLEESSLAAFTTNDIQSLAKIVEQRIISTQIGTYVLQGSVPATGTWEQVGTIIDTRRTTTSASFSGGAAYLGASTQYYQYYAELGFNGRYPPDFGYVSSFTGEYFGPRPVYFFGYQGLIDPPLFGYFGQYNATYFGDTVTTYFGWYTVYAPQYIPNSAYYQGSGINYVGELVSSTTETISTISLWKRIL